MASNVIILLRYIMGRYLNPSNINFKDTVNSRIYVDKTGLLSYTNRVLETNGKFICNSRPRRFGKSTTADMLTAYYSKGCDSKELFSQREIANDDTFEKHLNKYDVIHVDIQGCLANVKNDAEDVIDFIEKSVITELVEEHPNILNKNITTLTGALSEINVKTGIRFIIIIDEWDVLIRNNNDEDIQRKYIDFLRGLFKGTEQSRYIALAYLTGILPIVKQKTESALNNFIEFTMLDSNVLSKYIGFTEEEVRSLCKQYEVDFNEVLRWYDGYLLGDYHVYNPRAVIGVMESQNFQSYWSLTSNYDSILPYISKDFDGLKEDIILMLSGEKVNVNTNTYKNDMVSFTNKDQVITMLIHLGYLAYNQKEKMAYIPNEEIRQELFNAVNDDEWEELTKFTNKSLTLVKATINKDSSKVAEEIDAFHDDYSSIIKYNDENSLSAIITIAYLASSNYYFKPIRELPTGKGFADFIYLPKDKYVNTYPALVIELKYDKNAVSAIKQIKDKNYPKAIEEYTGNILLVGINYNKDSKKHTCIIEDYKIK